MVARIGPGCAEGQGILLVASIVLYAAIALLISGIVLLYVAHGDSGHAGLSLFAGITMLIVAVILTTSLVLAITAMYCAARRRLGNQAAAIRAIVDAVEEQTDDEDDDGERGVTVDIDF